MQFALDGVIGKKTLKELVFSGVAMTKYKDMIQTYKKYFMKPKWSKLHEKQSLLDFAIV